MELWTVKFDLVSLDAGLIHMKAYRLKSVYGKRGGEKSLRIHGFPAWGIQILFSVQRCAASKVFTTAHIPIFGVLRLCGFFFLSIPVRVNCQVIRIFVVRSFNVFSQALKMTYPDAEAFSVMAR